MINFLYKIKFNKTIMKKTLLKEIYKIMLKKNNLLLIYKQINILKKTLG